MGMLVLLVFTARTCTWCLTLDCMCSHPAVPYPGADLLYLVHMGYPVIEMSTTLSGGSLGSCVDEERSQLCELM